MTGTTTLDRELLVTDPVTGEELDLTHDVLVEYEYTRGTPGRFYGPPDGWAPPEGPELEIRKAIRGDTCAEVTLTEGEYNRVFEIAEREWVDSYYEPEERPEDY